MQRTVLLLHTTPDGTAHFDWMIERAGCTDERRLRTWRCEARPDELGWDGRAEAIADHRAAYLDYEGPIGGQRGEVHRVAAGEVLAMGEDEGLLDITVRWTDRAVRYRGRDHGSGGWIFVEVVSER